MPQPQLHGAAGTSPGSQLISCPTCGMTYRLFWVTPELPRIRGPVWEVSRKLTEETLAKDGVPRPETLTRLGLDLEPTHLL